MDKEKGTTTKQWRLSLIYRKEQVDSFWSKTDSKTRSAVQRSAKPQNTEEFRQKIRKRLSKAETQYLSDCSASELETLFSRYLGQAEDRREHHDGDMRVLNRARKESSKFLNNFNDYVQAYSAVIQMMNGVGPNYGDMAYGALSLLLVVAVNKEKTEDIISNTLATLQVQYSRIQRLKNIYATATMKEHIAVVYRLGIEFANEAAQYYSIGTFRRFLHLLYQPPSIALDGKVSAITKAIEEMRLEMETQDRIRLNNVERKLGDVEAKVDHVEESVEVVHVRAENDRLESLKYLLRVDEQDAQTFVRDYDRLLTNTFSKIRKLPPFDAEKQLFGRDDFIYWRNHSQSSLILLQGKTVAPDHTFLSWHSSATARLVRDPDKYLFDMRSSQTPTVVHCFCQVTDYYQDNHPPLSSSTVMSTIIYQLLKSKNARPLLRDDNRHVQLKRDIEDLRSHPAAKPTDQLSNLNSLLASLLTDMALTKAFIVLDRVDRIQDNVENFLASLLNLIEEAKCVLKVLITMRTEHNFNDSMMENMSMDTYTRVILDQD